MPIGVICNVLAVAVGGLIMLATGFRIAKIRDFPVADMIPAMILVWPISYAWAAWIIPIEFSHRHA